MVVRVGVGVGVLVVRMEAVSTISKGNDLD